MSLAFSLITVTAMSLPAGPTADASGIDWVHDDWGAAKARAKKAEQLVAVDVWATWCHTCLSMKNFVLKEKPLDAVKDRHVFLALDYDLEKNADFFATFPVNAFPTFLVVDPASNEVVARWVGSGTAEEMAQFFADAGRLRNAELTQAHRMISAGDYAGAASLLAAEIGKTADREMKTALLSAYVEAMWKHDPARCATEGSAYLGETIDNAHGLDYAGMVLMCAASLEPIAAADIARKVTERLKGFAASPPKSLATDDVSSTYETLAYAYEMMGDKKRADAISKKRLALLEKAAKEAKTSQARATFDYHRVGLYLKFKRHDDAIRMLTASERAQPNDFNHPWRLALVYLDKGDTKRGLAAIDRALARGYGARRLRLHTTKIDLLLAAKDAASAQKQLEQARAESADMNPAQVRKSWMQMLESRAPKIQELMKKVSS